MSNIADFLSFISSKGFNCKKLIKYNSFIRFGRNNEFWLIFYGECGFFGNWRTGEKYHWFSKRNNDQDAHKKYKYYTLKMQLDTEIRDNQEKIAKEAQKIYHHASLTGFSDYLKKKQIKELENVSV
ncbi:hypothetical protein [Rickettsiales endosymbiont of Stachyamoeba lipophora]|uniref:hypothetical protein n=1 Tax=Rickettsiales endosymbiont of Stachyamoeba lipophora TaxID=2486578 RepID=UPI000F653263|nr:hypothetical protein [Rickettsiales endosymbiont of Stachyamoeba lipophora]AZL15273.1 hypothetical protein EF513_01710 [Rickettsiales endosymbiont of Stachyamoeba lipophora]